MMSKILQALALVAALSGSAASAVTVTVAHVYDPINIVQGSINGEALLSNVTLGAGDTLELTITFLSGATITGIAEDGIWSLLTTANGPSGNLQTSGTLEFLGASANVVAGPIALSQQNSFVHVGSQYLAPLYRTDAAPISFTGLRQIITIDSDDIGVSRDYDRIAVTYFSGFLGAAAVPEPASWAMLIAGLCMVGAAQRRARRQIVAA